MYEYELAWCANGGEPCASYKLTFLQFGSVRAAYSAELRCFIVGFHTNSAASNTCRHPYGMTAGICGMRIPSTSILQKQLKGYGMEQRQTWSSRLTYILTVAGATIGFGATWRFPYLVGQNGGGAYVLMFILVMLLWAFPSSRRKCHWPPRAGQQHRRLCA